MHQRKNHYYNYVGAVDTRFMIVNTIDYQMARIIFLPD